MSLDEIGPASTGVKPDADDPASLFAESDALSHSQDIPTLMKLIPANRPPELKDARQWGSNFVDFVAKA